MSPSKITRRAFAALPAMLCRAADPEILSVEKIWDASPHNAFTDLTRFRGSFYCTFRAAEKHVSNDGAIVILVSKDAKSWKKASELRYDGGDLRDPKLAITPKGELMVTAAVAFRDNPPVRHQSLTYLSPDGHTWSKPNAVGPENFWIWRVNWRGKHEALAMGYSTGQEQPKSMKLFRTTDGRHFDPIDANLPEDGNETSILFDEDGTARCLLRRDTGDRLGMIGVAKAPYREWIWRSAGIRLGGPHWIRLANGHELAALRLYDNKVRTSLCWVEGNRIEEFLPLPSGGDTSYAGLVEYQKKLYVSYYSSHEGKTSIYLATVKL